MNFGQTILFLLSWTAIGLFVAKQKWISKKDFIKLNRFTFKFILPFFIILSIFTRFTYEFFLTHIFIVFGQFFFIFIAALHLPLFKKEHKKYGFNLTAFQNAGYLPLPIIIALSDTDDILLLLFLYLVGFNLAIFTIGYWVVNKKSQLKSILNPPLVATTIAIILSLLTARTSPIAVNSLINLKTNMLFILNPLENSLKLVLVPIILFIFGGTTMYNFANFKLDNISTHIKISLIKYIEFPIIMWFIIRFFSFSPIVSLLLMIESLMPPAMNLLLMPEKEEDILETSNYLLFQYAVFLLIVVPGFVIFKMTQ